MYQLFIGNINWTVLTEDNCLNSEIKAPLLFRALNCWTISSSLGLIRISFVFPFFSVLDLFVIQKEENYLKGDLYAKVWLLSIVFHLFIEHIDCHMKLQRIIDNIRALNNEEDFIQNGTRDITQLCAANVILWTQFLETATLQQGIIFHLAKDHHSSRVSILPKFQIKKCCKVVRPTKF